MLTSAPTAQPSGPLSAAPISRRQVRTVKIYWPISARTMEGILAGDTTALDRDGSFRDFAEVLEESPALGDFGNYSNVFEISLGLEGFTTGAGARPTLGAHGERTLSPTLAVTVHVAASLTDDELNGILGRVLEAHPWEIPVVELSSPIELIVRGETS